MATSAALSTANDVSAPLFVSTFFPNAFHRTPCDHSLTTARDHHCEASRPELEVGGSGGRVVLPPSPLKEPRTAGHWEPRVEIFRASPTASRLLFVRTAPCVAALCRLSIPGLDSTRWPQSSRILRGLPPLLQNIK
uniref:Uncharacterized protein n=1 Tax=Oryza rufipogon TaxID=4529 RepID=A0A0E0P504_ORYRU